MHSKFHRSFAVKFNVKENLYVNPEISLTIK